MALSIKKTASTVKRGDLIEVTMQPPKRLGALPLPPGEMGVSVLFNHSDFLIVYNPAGLMMHAPYPRSQTVTLVDWLIHSFDNLATVGDLDRPGIVRC